LRYVFRAVLALVLALILILLLRNCGSEAKEARRRLTPVPLPLATVTRILTPRPEPKPLAVPDEKVPLPQVIPTTRPTPRPPTPTPLPQGTGSLEGFVRHYRSESSDIIPYPGARVYALIAGQQIGGALTDESGLFRITALPVGNFRLRIVVPTAYDFDHPPALYLASGQSLYGINILLEEEFAPDQVNISLAPSVTPGQINAIAARHGCQVISSDSEKNRYTFRIPYGKTVPAMIAQLGGDSQIDTANPNYYYHMVR